MNAPFAPPFPANPAVGDFWQNWVWNGNRWVAASQSGTRVVTQVFQASAPYMPSPGLVSLVVECVGAGGGGGGAVSQWNGVMPPGAVVPGFMNAGGGGSSGGYSRKTLDASLVLGGVVVTVGVGGTGGGPSTSGANGGPTSFGGMCLANGGNGGDANNFINAASTPNMALWGIGGMRAAVGIGDFVSRGNAGQSGEAAFHDPSISGQLVFAGSGGASFFGGNQHQALAAANHSEGGPAVPPSEPGTTGSGGAGGASANSGEPVNGYAGGAGVCIVTEYCWVDACDSGSCPPSNCVNVNANPCFGTWHD